MPEFLGNNVSDVLALIDTRLPHVVITPSFDPPYRWLVEKFGARAIYYWRGDGANAQGYYLTDSPWTDWHADTEIRFMFRDLNDAIEFKLMWG